MSSNREVIPPREDLDEMYVRNALEAYLHDAAGDPTTGYAYPFPGVPQFHSDMQQIEDAIDAQVGLATSVQQHDLGLAVAQGTVHQYNHFNSEGDINLESQPAAPYGTLVAAGIPQLAGLDSNLDPQLLDLHHQAAHVQQQEEQAAQYILQGGSTRPSSFYDALHQEVYNEFFFADDEASSDDVPVHSSNNTPTKALRRSPRNTSKSTPDSEEPKETRKTTRKRKSAHISQAHQEEAVAAAEASGDTTEVSTKRHRMKPAVARRLRVEEGRQKYGDAYIMPTWLECLSEKEKLARSCVHTHLEGIPVLSHWDTRGEVYECCVHRDNSRTVAGGEIAGAFSLVLGGYNSEGTDNGETFTMLGEGGRGVAEDSAARREAFNIVSKDSLAQNQRWGRGNLALRRNRTDNLPVRVIRSHEGAAPFSPARGFRYDGLYQVTAEEIGTSNTGFEFILFTFVRLPGQPPLPRTALQ